MQPLTLHPNTILRRTDRVQFARLDDEMLAIDAQEGYCYSLNATAIKVWELLAIPTSLASLCEQLSAAYGVDYATCAQDVTELLQELKEAKLLQVQDEPSPQTA